MVDTQLTPELMKEGAALIARLDASGVRPEAALWMHLPDAGTWRLLIADKKVGEDGPRAVYRTVQKALTALRGEVVHLSLMDITVATPDVPMIRLLRQSVKAAPDPGGIHVRRNVVKGTMIEDSYVYRLRKPAA